MQKPLNPQDLIANAKAQITEISPYDAKHESQDSVVYLIDVRESKEYAQGHLPNAVNIPRGVLEFKILDEIFSLDTPIIVYCQTGGRASLSAVALQTLGFSNVKSIAGGIAAWEKSGFAIVKPHTNFY